MDVCICVENILIDDFIFLPHNFCNLEPPCSDVQPSFVLMDIQGPKITMYVYRIIDDELKVQRIEHTK